MTTDPVTAYATAVGAGRIVAGRMVRLACARHLSDIQTQLEKGLDWRPEAAQLGIDFFSDVLCLPEETASSETSEDVPEDGSPFVLMPWQAFIIGSLLGWYTAAGFRRFHDAYAEIAKGNGKTPLFAGLMLYLLVADGERGAQVYFAAVGKDQARLAFADAEKMVNASPALRDLIDQKVNNLAVLQTGSFLRAISSEKRGLDGKRVHGAFIDEEHEHPTPVVVSKMRRGTKGRRNAIVVRATNSGFDRTSVCWMDHEYSRKVLEGVVVDETWFAFVTGLDPCEECQAKGHEFVADDCAQCDDWRVEGPHWLKAAPNLGVSISWQYYRDLVRQAIARPDVVSDLLRFNFCVWTQSYARAINLARWTSCQPRPKDADLVGVPCFGGLDLGQSDDFTAWARVWALEDGRIAVKMRFWIPRAALEKYPNRPYAEWERAGALTVTDGEATDYGLVETAIADDCRTDGIREVAYDKKFAEQMAQNLTGQGLTMIDTAQGFQLNEAIVKMLALVTNGTLCHGGHPVLSWMAANFVLRSGKFKEVRPDKEHAADKIDGMVALCMAVDRIVRQRVVAEEAYQMFFVGGRP